MNKQSNWAKFGLLCALLTVTQSVCAGVSDGAGHIWTPDGRYTSNRAGADAEFNTRLSYGALTMGNACSVEGRLTRPNKSKPTFVLKVTGADGVSCPNVQRIFITIVDGYAVRAFGNASKIKISHASQKGKVNFSGTYLFEELLDSH